MTGSNGNLVLNSKTVARAKAGTSAFCYDRSRLAPGIVHLGLGAFARAHIAEYTDDVLAREFGGWGIVGVNLRSTDQKARLVPQDGLYTLVSRSDAGDSARIVGAVTGVLAGSGDLSAILDLLAAPCTRIVSLTVTEKGYCHSPATGRLDAAHPDIRHDLEDAASPRSAVGVLVAALARRRAAGLAPFTVLCCDNLPHNGRLVGALVGDFAALSDDRLASWIERNGAFPSTMVDRIVPAMTDADVARAEALTGLADAAPVAHEPFRQWVVEDRFVDGARPAWQEVGAELVVDVEPFEAMKLRLLNASHSALAYLGYLGGHETIADCVRDPVYRTYVEALWRDEIIPVTPPPPGQDLAAYAKALLARYDNRAIRHRTWQIAMDGSQKLPQRLLATVRARLARDLPIPRLALAVAAWMIYVAGRDLGGKPIDVRDPLATRLQERLAAVGKETSARVAALLSQTAIFGDDLAADPEFSRGLVDAYDRLASAGPRAAIAAIPR